VLSEIKRASGPLELLINRLQETMEQTLESAMKACGADIASGIDEWKRLARECTLLMEADNKIAFLGPDAADTSIELDLEAVFVVRDLSGALRNGSPETNRRDCEAAEPGKRSRRKSRRERRWLERPAVSGFPGWVETQVAHTDRPGVQPQSPKQQTSIEVVYALAGVAAV